MPTSSEAASSMTRDRVIGIGKKGDSNSITECFLLLELTERSFYFAVPYRVSCFQFAETHAVKIDGDSTRIGSQDSPRSRVTYKAP
jgi:hypothetical protein